MTTQVPEDWKETTPALIEHTEEADASIVKVTGRLEVAVAAGVYVAPATAAATGAEVVKEIVWLPAPTAKDC